MKLTTDEAIRRLFPKRVIKEARQVASGSDVRANLSIERDTTE